MNIPQDDLDRWVTSLASVSAAIMHATVAVERGDRERAQSELSEAQEKVNTTKRSMIRLGGVDQTPDRFIERGFAPLQPTPLHLMDTPANRRYARALRDAYEALQEVEAERGAEHDQSARLYETLAAVELEVYGPAGNGRE